MKICSNVILIRLDVSKAIGTGHFRRMLILSKLLKKKVILSSGMANKYEIDIAINTLKKKGTSIKNISLLHCNLVVASAYWRSCIRHQ